jgi:hypothetical protein
LVPQRRAKPMSAGQLNLKCQWHHVG